MWISREEYNVLRNKATKLEKLQIECSKGKNIQLEKSMIINEKSKIINEKSKELFKIKKDLEYYLDTHEEKGVVHIPKFVVKKIVYGY